MVYANEKKKCLSLHDTYYRDCKLISVSSVKLSSNGMTQESIVLLSFTLHILVSLFHFTFLLLWDMVSSSGSNHCLHRNI